MPKEDFEKRLERVELQCDKIPEIQQSLSRIEYELIGDGFGNRVSYKSRLEKVEEGQVQINGKVNKIEERQKNMFRASTGGAGIITIIINFLKELFTGG